MMGTTRMDGVDYGGRIEGVGTKQGHTRVVGLAVITFLARTYLFGVHRPYIWIEHIKACCMRY